MRMLRSIEKQTSEVRGQRSEVTRILQFHQVLSPLIIPLPVRSYPASAYCLLPLSLYCTPLRISRDHRASRPLTAGDARYAPRESRIRIYPPHLKSILPALIGPCDATNC